jgi:hypothetical protein
MQLSGIQERRGMYLPSMQAFTMTQRIHVEVYFGPFGEGILKYELFIQ